MRELICINPYIKSLAAMLSTRAPLKRLRDLSPESEEPRKRVKL